MLLYTHLDGGAVLLRSGARRRQLLHARLHLEQERRGEGFQGT